MVSVDTDTVDIYCFHKNRHETVQEHLPFRLPMVSLKQIETFLHFSFKTGRKFFNSKPRTPGKESYAKPRAKKVMRNPEPPGSENVRISGVTRGGGCSGLELTDT